MNSAEDNNLYRDSFSEETSAILNFTALYRSRMFGLGMYLEVAVQNLAFILISKAAGLAFAYIGYGLHGLALGLMIGALSCLPAYISINASTLQALAETKVLAKIGAT